VARYLIPRSQSKVLDAGGGGFVAFAIDNTNVRWVIDEVTVETNQAPVSTPVPQCRFRLQDPVNGLSQGGTSSGNFDTATGRVVLYTGDVLYAVWTGGIAGSLATATIGGTFDPAGADLGDG
jgi:hypothetical protein